MLAGVQRDFQAIGDGARDFVLDFEDILEFAIEAFGPEVVAIGDIDKLGHDADAVAGFANATFENGFHIEAFADNAEIDVLAFEGEG